MKDNVIEKMDKLVNDLILDIKALKRPQLRMPVRSLQNVEYGKEGYFKLKEKIKVRSFNVNTIKSFAQTLKMISLSKTLINTKDMATKRDVYYQSKNWGNAKFDGQPESDDVMDDIEAMFYTIREELKFNPDRDGSAVVGNIIIKERDRETEELIEIDCSKMGTGGYNLPSNVENFEFDTKAKFILAIETGGMFERLAYHKFWAKQNCILVLLKGVPGRSTRRFVRKLSDEHKLPVYVFTDGDPYGWLNIYRTLKVGSGNAAHINKHFCVPNARYFGITAKDIKQYNLPTHKLKDVDIKRIKDGLKNDPFVKNHPDWQQNLNETLKLGKRAEQQALAAHGLNFVISDYLPNKLNNPKDWLT